MEKMIAFFDGNIHDVDHFIRVWTYARTIGELENLDRETQFVLEVAAITHDIACPLCRVKYGNTNGKYQEEEGIPMVKEYLSDTGIAKHRWDRLSDPDRGRLYSKCDGKRIWTGKHCKFYAENYED